MESWITELAVLKTRGTAGLETLDQELQPWSRARPSESCLRAVADLILPSWSKVAEDRLPVHTNLLQQANLRMHEELAEQKAQDLELKAMEREEELTRKVTKMRSAVTPPATEAGDEEARKKSPNQPKHLKLQQKMGPKPKRRCKSKRSRSMIPTCRLTKRCTSQPSDQKRSSTTATASS